MPEPIVDGDQEVTTPSGKKLVLPPPDGTESPLYNARPADNSGKDSATPHVDDFLDKYNPDKVDALGHQLSGIEKQRGAAEQSEYKRVNDRLEADRAQFARAQKAESADLNAVPPNWDADRERKDRVRGPLEDFASLGSIFGILASAFTKTPMTSALNASAAAMTAIKNSDEEGYKSAYQAWKDNTALAMKRFDMERALTDDALKTFNLDQDLGKVKLLSVAAQFDDKKAIAMLDAGMAPELIQAKESMVTLRDKLQKSTEDFETWNLKKDLYASQVANWEKEHPPADPKNMTPQEVGQRLQARHDIMEGLNDPGNNIQLKLLRELGLEHPDWTTEQKIEYMQQHQVGKVGGIGGAPTKEKEVSRRLSDWVAKRTAEGNPPGPDEVDAQDDKIRQEVATASQPAMTPNKRVDLQRRVTQYGEATKTLDDAIQVLDTHAGAAGLAGRATRLGERVENIFGSSKTDREQFMRNIQYLRTAAQSLLFDRASRPLAADADRINDIIGGLSLGDTTANTLRSLKEVKDRLGRLQKSQEDQLENKWTPDPPANQARPPTAGKAAWEEAPIVGQ